MTLSELLAALANNQKLCITLADTEGVEMITFNAPGYESIEGDLGSREVKRIKIASQTSVVVTLEDATP